MFGLLDKFKTPSTGGGKGTRALHLWLKTVVDVERKEDEKRGEEDVFKPE